MTGHADLREPLLADDYPIYAGYCYVADGKPVVSDHHGVTVRQFKVLIDAQEIRRCDIAGRARRQVSP